MSDSLRSMSTIHQATGSVTKRNSSTISPGSDRDQSKMETKKPVLKGADFSDNSLTSSNTGTRPKTKYQDVEDLRTGKQNKQKAPENVQDKGHVISLNIEYILDENVQNTSVDKSCTVDEYMKWQFILHSKVHLGQLNELVAKKYCAKIKRNGLLQVGHVPNIVEVLKISNSVVELALEQEGITVKQISVNFDLIEGVYDQIKDNPGLKATCHVEMINTTEIFIAFMSRNSHKVNEFIRTICGDSSKPSDGMVTHQITLDPIWKKWNKMIILDKALKEAVNEERFEVNVESVAEALMVTLLGTKKCIDIALAELKNLKENMRSEQCNFMITHTKALAELSVVGYLEEMLDRKKLKCFVSEKKGHLYVNGFNQQVVTKACKVIESNIIEKPIIVNEGNRDRIQRYETIAVKTHSGCIVFHYESKQKLFLIGVKEFVEDFVQKVSPPTPEKTEDCLQFNESARAVKSQTTSESASSVASLQYLIIKLRVPNDNARKFIESSLIVGQFCQQNKLELDLEKEDDAIIATIRGDKSALNEADKFFHNLMDRFSQRTENVNNIKGELYMLEDEGRKLLQDWVRGNDVLLSLHADQSGSCIEDVQWYPDRECERHCSWSDPQNSRFIKLVSTKYWRTSQSYCIEFKPANNNAASAMKRRKSGVIVNVPPWNEGKTNVKFVTTLNDVLEVAEKSEICEIVMMLHYEGYWPLKKFTRRIAKSVIHWLTSGNQQSMLHTVILQSHDNSDYNTMKEEMNREFQLNHMADSKNELSVMVVAGELSSIKADVLVNTTGKDLDLSVGKVSKSLLKAAGKSLQTECCEKYPNGIGNDEIAVTNGYKLHAYKVLHISLDRYMQSGANDMDSIQIIRYLVGQCLDITSKSGHQSIAFPAIGTGVLQYPEDLVSAAMFESVEKFKSNNPRSSIKTVMFVIYPKNVKVMEVFQTNERKLYKSKKLKNEMKKSWSTFTVSGMEDKVNITIDRVREIIAEANIDPNEIIEKVIEDFTRMTFILWKHHYSGDYDKSMMEQIKMLHNENRRVLSLRGKRNIVEPWIEKINAQRKALMKMHQKRINVSEFDPKYVDFALDTTFAKHIDHCPMFVCDAYIRMIYICGDSGIVKAFATDLVAALDKVVNSVESGMKADGQSSSPDKLKKVFSKSFRSPLKDKEVSPQMFKKALSFDSDGGNHRKLSTKGSRIGSSIDGAQEAMEVTEETQNAEKVRTYSTNSTSSIHSQGDIACKMFQVGGSVVHVYKGDILQVHADCIVNPANKALGNHGGLAGIIARAAGKDMNMECEDILKINGVTALPVAGVVVTGAGLLPFRKILHAVGPCWYDYSIESKLQCAIDLCATVVNCLNVAENLGFKIIALPMISSGLFGVPRDVCATQYSEALTEFCKTSQNILKEIHFMDIRTDMVKTVQDEFTTKFTEITNTENHSGVCNRQSNVSNVSISSWPSNKDSNIYLSDPNLRNSGADESGSRSHRSSSSDIVDPNEARLSQGFEAMEIDEATPGDVSNKTNIARSAQEQTSSGRLYKKFMIGEFKVLVYGGDILDTRVDCIVNPANCTLDHKEGLAKVIAKAAGKKMTEECKAMYKKNGKKGFPVSSVILTGPGELQYLGIMHAVGPCWIDYTIELKPDCAQDVCNTVRNCLVTAENESYTTIALPMISTGLFGVPQEICAAQYSIALMEFSKITRNIIKEVHFVSKHREMVKKVLRKFTEEFTHRTNNDNVEPQSPTKTSNLQDPRLTETSLQKVPLTEGNDNTVLDNSRSVEPDMGGSNRLLRTSRSQPDPRNPDTSTDEGPQAMEVDQTIPDGGQDRSRVSSMTTKSDKSDIVQSGHQHDVECDGQFIKSTFINSSMEDAATASSTVHDLGKQRDRDRGNDIDSLQNMNCVICMDTIINPRRLKCGHIFCADCIGGYFKVKQVCPTCGQVFGVVTGNQPNGTMEIQKTDKSLSGFEKIKTISMLYNFPPGKQSSHHPNPGTPYRGISRIAFLPDTPQGREICSMLKMAFERKLVFTIGVSRTTGAEGVITWNDIHHKTDPNPNTQFGYPDNTYLDRVRDELAAKGIFDSDPAFVQQLKKSSFHVKVVAV